MLAVRSSLARLMLAIATTAVGLVTIRTQAEFWLGVLATFSLGWALLALTQVLAAPDWRRSPWLVGVVAFGLGLGYGFGPWSDVMTRGSRPLNPLFLPQYDRELLRTSAGLLYLADRLGLNGRSAIYLVDWQSTEPPVVLIVDSGKHGLMPELATRMRNVGPAVFFFASWRVAFDACYLMGSLALGATMGLICAGLARRELERSGRSRVSPDREPMGGVVGATPA